MQVNVQQLSPVLVEFQVEVEADLVKSEVEKAYQALQKSARVRGFRPGKAPRDVLSHLYGDRVAIDVTQRLVDETLNKALSEKNVQPLSQPAIEPQKLKTGKNFSYKARFEVRPDIELVRYDGFDVKRPKTVATDEMVEAELAKLQKSNAILKEPSPARTSQTGDVLSIDFEIDIDGKKVAGAGGQGLSVELGSGQFLPELDAGLLGTSAGEQKDVQLTFGENHARPDFRGKQATFHLTVKDVKEKVLPALDDEFAKDMGSHETLEALKENLKGQIEKSLKQRAEDSVAEQLVLKLCEVNPIPCPPTLVEQQCRMMEQEIVQQARRGGQQVPADLHQRVHADSEMKVRAGLLMAEIAKSAQIKINDDDLEKGLAELAEQTGKQLAKLKVEYRDQKKREMLIGMILEDKILDIIEAKANVVDE